MKYSLWAAPAAALLLSGCQSFCEKPPAAPTPSATAAPVLGVASENGF